MSKMNTWTHFSMKRTTYKYLVGGSSYPQFKICLSSSHLGLSTNMETAEVMTDAAANHQVAIGTNFTSLFVGGGGGVAVMSSIFMV